MKHKTLLIYSWFVRIMLILLPDIPFIMRFRGWLYSLAMNRCGKNFQVTHSAILNALEMIRVGDNVYIANYCSIIANGLIEIGDNVLFGPGVCVSGGNHKFENGQLLKVSDPKNVKIGNNCWVAANCTIVGGANLPYGSILAANSVLTSKLDVISTESVYGGVPARFIKTK